jgi:hypothetical protein
MRISIPRIAAEAGNAVLGVTCASPIPGNRGRNGFFRPDDAGEQESATEDDERRRHEIGRIDSDQRQDAEHYAAQSASAIDHDLAAELGAQPIERRLRGERIQPRRHR